MAMSLGKVFELRGKMPRQYPYRLPTYNGFSHEERVATNPVQRAAAQRGEFRFPDTCSICGFSDPPNIRASGYIWRIIVVLWSACHAVSVVTPLCTPVFESLSVGKCLFADMPGEGNGSRG
jgi:hypothetical protein